MPDDLLTATTKAIIWRLHQAEVGYGTELLAPGADPPVGLPMLAAKDKPPGPDRIISVTTYSRTASPNPALKDRVLSFQLWIRGAPDDRFDPDSIASACFDALHGQHHVTWGGLVIDRCAHSYGSPMGPDDQHRWEWSDNYTLVTQQRSTP